MDSLRLRLFVLRPQASQSHRCFTFQHYSDPWKSIQASTKSQKSHPQRITEYTRMVLKRLEIFIIEINEKSKLGNISYSYNHGNVNRHQHKRDGWYIESTFYQFGLLLIVRQPCHNLDKASVFFPQTNVVFF